MEKTKDKLVYEKNSFRVSKFSSIISVIFLIPSAIIGVLATIYKENILLKELSFGMALFGMAFSIAILYGYISLAKQQKLGSLKNMALLNIIFIILTSPIIYFNLFHQSKTSMIFSFLYVIMVGIIYILFGRVLLKLKKFKDIRKIGILYIVMGAFELSIILLIFSPLLAIAVRIFEAKLFNRLGKS